MIGGLKHALKLQEKHRVPDGGGGWHEVWQDVTLHPLVYAAIAAAGGGETLRFHQRHPQTSHKITLRFRGDVAAGMRLVDAARGKAYEVLSIRDATGEERWLEIFARQTTA